MMNSPQKKAVALQDRFALKTVAYLSAGTTELPYDISERLRAARAQAVSQRKVAKTQTAAAVISNGGSAALGWGADEGLSWWGRIGSVLPLVALVVGLLAINSFQNDNRAQELAEVDAALLTDELPPAAFADPGFVQFLKITRPAAPLQ
ncbi:MAG: putative transrane protein [Polaromonas sp.]|nr:putative transrane protein [Polaromonas sp.]